MRVWGGHAKPTVAPGLSPPRWAHRSPATHTTRLGPLTHQPATSHCPGCWQEPPGGQARSSLWRGQGLFPERGHGAGPGVTSANQMVSDSRASCAFSLFSSLFLRVSQRLRGKWDPSLSPSHLR